MIRVVEHEFLLKNLALVTHIIFVLILNLVLNQLLNDIFHGDNTDDALCRIFSMTTSMHGRDYADVRKALFEVVKEWLNLVHVIDHDDVTNDDTRQLLKRKHGFVRVYKDKVARHQNAHDVVATPFVDRDS